jgi:hypothetical protein
MKVKLLKRLRKNYSIIELRPDNNMPCTYGTTYYRLLYKGKKVDFAHSLNVKHLIMVAAYYEMPFKNKPYSNYKLHELFDNKTACDYIFNEIKDRRKARIRKRYFDKIESGKVGKKVWYNV